MPLTLYFGSLEAKVNAGLPREKKSEIMKISKSNALLGMGENWIK